MTDKKEFFIPENKIEDPVEKYSLSKKYKLVIQPYKTKPGCWKFSLGSVYKGDELIAEVQRNYHSFPATFIENHANGHDYLICGENYQGQTIIELDTGKRIDNLPTRGTKGAGFCWVQHSPSPDGKLLAVDGCYWACPYEVIIFDFSDPMNPESWEEIYRTEIVSDYINWTSNTECDFVEDLTCFKLYDHIDEKIRTKYEYLHELLETEMYDEEKKVAEEIEDKYGEWDSKIMKTHWKQNEKHIREEYVKEECVK